jgi:hypothetical protein
MKTGTITLFDTDALFLEEYEYDDLEDRNFRIAHWKTQFTNIGYYQIRPATPDILVMHPKSLRAKMLIDRLNKAI